MYSGLIKKIKDYIKLTADEENLIPEFFKERIVTSKDHFLKEGNICNELAFINEGLLYYSISKNGNEIITNFAKEGDFVCNYDSFLNNSASAKDIKAIETTTLLVITKTKLQEFYSKFNEGEKFGRLIIEKEYSESIRQIISLYTNSPEERYLRLVQNFPKLVPKIPQYFIAAYVGVRPQSLSRIRKRLSIQKFINSGE